ncbi:MAG TPA: cytochrome c oxidase assembly protein [Solirubrobacteraceae bacterium]|nr:cytochrome c oxidase assembly protein [Solirubrobacteraceae bacterium]
MPGLPLAFSADASAAFQLVPLALLAAAYTRRARTLQAGGQGVARWRQACFYGGLAVVAAALSSLGAASERLLWVDTIEQLLLGDLAALLLVLGLSAALLAPIVAVGALGRLRLLTRPALASSLWALDLYAWHLRALYEAALAHPAVHALEHACLLGFAVNMWMCLLGPLPGPSWFGNAARLAYVLAVRLAAAGLGNVLLWSGTILYPYYLSGQAHFHISPLADQSIAGTIVIAESSLVTLGLFCWLFARSARELREREQLLDYARARGVELSEQRAGQAAAAGVALELRLRLEALLEAPDPARERRRRARPSGRAPARPSRNPPAHQRFARAQNAREVQAPGTVRLRAHDHDRGEQRPLAVGVPGEEEASLEGAARPAGPDRAA